ncbi:MAG: hypothetical protein U9R41_01910 [Candidatus Marinimicrobia bacterium]|nr:hypothetical protein [Candidatus Neomarinimicrobiota bacterium]
MRKFRFILIGIATIIAIANLIIIDYSNLNWTTNAGFYLGIASMILLIIAMIISNYAENKNSYHKEH